MQKKLGFLKKIIMAGLATLVLTGWGAVTAPAQTVPLISKDEVKEALTSPHVTIIDVRVAKDWNASDKKIQGAVREDPEKVESWAQKYQHYQDIILYCAWPNEWTSSRVGRKLMQMGFSKISVLKGGWPEWSRSGYPTEKK